MAPERNADVDAVSHRRVIPQQRLVLSLREVECGRMHHDVVGPDILGVTREVDHHVHVLIGARHDRLSVIAGGFHRQLKRTLAFLQRHREELALLARDEEPFDPQLLGPVADVLSKAVLIEAMILGKRHQGSCPDAVHVGPSVGLCVASAVAHDVCSISVSTMNHVRVS